MISDVAVFGDDLVKMRRKEVETLIIGHYRERGGISYHRKRGFTPSAVKRNPTCGGSGPRRGRRDDQEGGDHE